MSRLISCMGCDGDPVPVPDCKPKSEVQIRDLAPVDNTQGEPVRASKIEFDGHTYVVFRLSYHAIAVLREDPQAEASK